MSIAGSAGEQESTADIMWRAKYMRRCNTKHTAGSSETANIDVLEDETSILMGELATSDDPAAQKRIKEMIDERKSIIVEQETAAD